MKSDKGDNCVVRVWVEIKLSTANKKAEHPSPKEVKRPRGRPVEVGNEAAKWLESYLKTGPKRAGDKKAPQPGTVFGDSLENGYKSNAVWRAAEKLGVIKYRDLKTRICMWALPESENIAYATR